MAITSPHGSDGTCHRCDRYKARAEELAEALRGLVEATMSAPCHEDWCGPGACKPCGATDDEGHSADCPVRAALAALDKSDP